MSDDASARLSLPFLAAGQAQKEVMHNEALQALDMLIQPVVVSASFSMPPGAPTEGDCWIVAASPGGDWTGHAGDIAQWTAGGWRFASPRAGWRCHVLDRGAAMTHDGSDWQDEAVRADGFYLGGERVVAARQPAITAPAGGAVVDLEARNAIAAVLDAMQAHGLIA